MEDDITAIKSSSRFQVSSSGTNKSNKQKMKKVEWTPELHNKFVEAIEELGVDEAVPSRILKFMKVESLTGQNIASHLQVVVETHKLQIWDPPLTRQYAASHLQKYRMQRRQTLSHARDSTQWSHYYPHKHVMAFPIAYHSNYNDAAQFGLSGVQMMLHAEVWGYPVMSPLGSTPSYPQLHADVWDYPVMPPFPGSSSSNPQNASGFSSAEADWMQSNMRNSIPEKYFDVHPGEELIDNLVKEIMSKPGLPLPLGLKPPPIDTILHELQPINGLHYRC